MYMSICPNVFVGAIDILNTSMVGAMCQVEVGMKACDIGIRQAYNYNLYCD